MSVAKARRQRAILRLLKAVAVHTHDELAAALADRGIEVSQGTLSRDLRELGVVKKAGRYAVAPGLDTPRRAIAELAAAIAQFSVETRTAGNLVVMRTRPGSAGALAQFLDAANLQGIVGTVAGDDTIFAATSDARTAKAVVQRLESL